MDVPPPDVGNVGNVGNVRGRSGHGFKAFYFAPLAVVHCFVNEPTARGKTPVGLLL